MFEIIFVKGGVVMVPIMALSIYALAIVFYKLYQFRKHQVQSRAFVETSLQLMKHEAYPEALDLLAREKGPVARVMHRALEVTLSRDLSRPTKEAEISRVAQGEVRLLESHMRGLEMVYTTAPLLGLLGTVLGMVSAFSKLATVGSRVDPTILAGGIWEALITTVGGLCVAVPALMAYYWLESIIERARANMRDTATQILALDDLFSASERSSAPVAQEMVHMPRPVALAPELAQQPAPAAMMQRPQSTKPAASQRARQASDSLALSSQRSAREAKAQPSRMSLFALAAAEDAPTNGAALSHETMEETPAKSSATSTLRLLSPTYTKF